MSQFYDEFIASEQRVAEVARAARVAHHHTSLVVVQTTRGEGHAVADFDFAYAFQAEPAVAHGSSLVSIGVAGQLPVASGAVTHWRRDGRGSYTGAAVVMDVTLRAAPGFAPPTVPGGTDASPVVAHHFTFTGMAGQRVSAATVTALMTTAPAATGMGAL